jgi:hypothetical protein
MAQKMRSLTSSKQSGKDHAPGSEIVLCVATLSTSTIVLGQHCRTSVLLLHILLFSLHHGSASGSSCSPAELRQCPGDALSSSWTTGYCSASAVAWPRGTAWPSVYVACASLRSGPRGFAIHP